MTSIDRETKPAAGATAPIVERKHLIIAIVAVLALLAYLVLWLGFAADPHTRSIPLLGALALGGTPLVLELLGNIRRREFGSDILAGISIITSLFLGEYLAGTLVVLMLSGGEALETYAVRSASSVLAALAKRMPSTAHKRIDGELADIALDAIEPADILVVFPHEICPVDGVVIAGHGAMDESYLTGEPYVMSKLPGAEVISGAINGESALTIRCTRRPVDSRYAKIMQVMRESEQRRPRLRRLGDQLGAIYTPLALLLAVTAWLLSGEATRFLAVLTIATPCPLLIAIPVSIIGSVSLAAKRGVIIKDPVVLEQLPQCRTMIFDKTGTLTYGEPQLVEQELAPGRDRAETLALVAAVERYSKHPLGRAIVDFARSEAVSKRDASEISERPGEGLQGRVEGKQVEITSRKNLVARGDSFATALAEPKGGLECVIVIDGVYAATYRFRDAPRAESLSFINHLGPHHLVDRVMLVSGDRESEVRYLADLVGISEVHAGKSPEEKVEIVRRETARAKTVFIGDGVNDAPALTAATVGVAFGQHSEVTTEAAGAVIMDSSLKRVDELVHISTRMRSIALESAVGGMALSVIGMVAAIGGHLSPVAGALGQEVIDLLAVLNALRAAFPPKVLSDIPREDSR